jgi:hypothetical protein
LPNTIEYPRLSQKEVSIASDNKKATGYFKTKMPLSFKKKAASKKIK